MKIEQMRFKNTVKYLQELTDKTFISKLYLALEERLGGNFLTTIVEKQLLREIATTLSHQFTDVLTAYIEDNYMVAGAYVSFDTPTGEGVLNDFAKHVLLLECPLDEPTMLEDDDFFYLLTRCAKAVQAYGLELKKQPKKQYPFGIVFNNDEELEEAMKLLASHGIEFATESNVH
ncbi:MAG: hypothetical protein IJ085_02075 [Turicibacter sp.]|nr:hypothetical protein [Turicibacter sp.]